MNPFEHLDVAIRQLRKRSGLSQRAAVDRIRSVTGSSINTMMISRWERGERSPTVDSLGALLWGLGYTLHDLCAILDELRRREIDGDWWGVVSKDLEVEEDVREELADRILAIYGAQQKK